MHIIVLACHQIGIVVEGIVLCDVERWISSCIPFPYSFKKLCASVGVLAKPSKRCFSFPVDCVDHGNLVISLRGRVLVNANGVNPDHKIAASLQRWYLEDCCGSLVPISAILVRAESMQEFPKIRLDMEFHSIDQYFPQIRTFTPLVRQGNVTWSACWWRNEKLTREGMAPLASPDAQQANILRMIIE